MAKMYKINNYANNLSGAELIANAQKLCKGKCERPTTIKESIRAMHSIGYTVTEKTSGTSISRRS